MTHLVYTSCCNRTLKAPTCWQQAGNGTPIRTGWVSRISFRVKLLPLADGLPLPDPAAATAAETDPALPLENILVKRLGLLPESALLKFSTYISAPPTFTRPIHVLSCTFAI